MTVQAAFILLAIALAAAPAWAQQAQPQIRIQPAEVTPTAKQHMILAAAKAGQRIVAVGEDGVVLLSDDRGKSFRQARSVPIQATLNAVSFVDDKTGWAAGHWGAIVKTTDGGETWQLQRSDTGQDRPIFSVLFLSPSEGFAVGLWSLVLSTKDGGATWREVTLPNPPGSSKADLNLYSVFADNKGSLFVTAEGGKLVTSDDHGVRWRYVETGYRGTFWTGLQLADGSLLIGGLRGTIYRSVDGGGSWAAARSEAQSSVTGLAQLEDGRIIGSALDGVLLTSEDHGASFQSRQRDDREVLTAVLPLTGGGYLVFTKHGIEN